MKKLKLLIAVLSLAAFITGGVATAASPPPCDPTKPPVTDKSGNPVACTCPPGYANPSGANGQVIVNECQQCANSTCTALGTDCQKTTNGLNCLKKNPIINDINNIVNFLAAAVGIVVIGMIIVGGVQYSMAGGNPNATEEARKRLTNAVIALVAFIFMYAFLQWLIPGGI